MEKNAVVFSGRNGLDSQELRAAALRIPEVSLRVKRAQDLIDGLEAASFDLHNYISSDDELFLRNIKLKSLAASIVQIGLFDRHIKSHKRPDFLVGNSNGDSALSVCAGRLGFEEMVKSSQALQTLRPMERIVLVKDAEPAPLLSGLSLTEYEAAELKVDADGRTGYAPYKSGVMDFRKLFAALSEEAGVRQFINIGPGNTLLGLECRTFGLGEATVVDSIEMDPMLSWFWSAARPPVAAMA